jgi:plastocyanin
MKTSTVVVVIVAILIIAGGAWWYTQTNTAAPSTQTTTINNANSSDYTPGTTSTSTATTTGSSAGVDVGVSVGTPKTVTITYTSGQGFSPASVTINKGDTVKFVAASGQMWIGSDEHPTHTEYDGTSRTTHCAQGYTGEKPFDQCAAGSSFNFTFTKAGTFDFHNHLAAQFEGVVVVK